MNMGFVWAGARGNSAPKIPTVTDQLADNCWASPLERMKFHDTTEHAFIFGFLGEGELLRDFEDKDLRV